MREIRLSGSEGGEAETTGLPYPYRPAQGNALGKGTPAMFLLCGRPNGPKIRLAARRTVGPLGRKKIVVFPFPRALP